MNTFARPLMTWCAALALALSVVACGGGGGGVSATSTTGNSTSTSTTTSTSTSTLTPSTPSTTSTTGIFLTGIAYPLALNDSVHVPSGTMVALANGMVTTLNAVTSTINVPGGTIITVPASATGPADILLTAYPSLPYTLGSTMPTTTAVAGSATASGSPIDGVGSAARFWGGGHLAVDKSGNLFVTDGAALRQVSSAGVVTTLEAAYVAYDWEGLAIDASGTIFSSGTSWAPPPNNYGATIQSRSSTGTLKTVVSNWTVSPTFANQGFGGLAVDTSGNLYLTDAPNHRILKFTPAGVMSVFAGNGLAGAGDGLGVNARFNNPTDLSMDGSGNLFVSDTGNSAVRRITPAGVVTTVAKQLSPGAIAASATGVVYFIAGSPRTIHRLNADFSLSVSFPLAGITDSITGLTVDSSGNVYAGTAGVGAQIFRINFN